MERELNKLFNDTNYNKENVIVREIWSIKLELQNFFWGVYIKRAQMQCIQPTELIPVLVCKQGLSCMLELFSKVAQEKGYHQMESMYSLYGSIPKKWLPSKGLQKVGKR